MEGRLATPIKKYCNKLFELNLLYIIAKMLKDMVKLTLMLFVRFYENLKELFIKTFYYSFVVFIFRHFITLRENLSLI